MPRGDQISRHWQILRMLEQSRHGLRATEIHEELERCVAERTIFRDLEALQKAGFPLVEQDGRWSVLTTASAGFSIPLAPTEVLALLLSEELLAPVRTTEIGAALTELREKMMRLLTPEGRSYVDEARPALVATFTAPSAAEANGEVLRLLEVAIREHQRLTVEYFTPGAGVSERRIDPYLLWVANGCPYIVAWCHLRGGFRLFSTARFRAVRASEERFTPVPGFDPRQMSGGAFGVWHGTAERVVLCFAPEVAHLAHERVHHSSQQVEDLPNGSARVTMKVSGLPNLAIWLAGFGGKVTVDEPDTLRAMVRELHRAGLAAFDGDQPAPE